MSSLLIVIRLVISLKTLFEVVQKPDKSHSYRLKIEYRYGSKYALPKK